MVRWGMKDTQDYQHSLFNSKKQHSRDPDATTMSYSSFFSTQHTA